MVELKRILEQITDQIIWKSLFKSLFTVYANNSVSASSVMHANKLFIVHLTPTDTYLVFSFSRFHIFVLLLRNIQNSFSMACKLSLVILGTS